MSILHIGEKEFDQVVLQSELPVLVDFWADWCGPCRMIAPIIEEIANEYNGKLIVAKVNVDENQDLAVEYGINTIPNLVVFKNGSVANQTAGVMAKDTIIQNIGL